MSNPSTQPVLPPNPRISLLGKAATVELRMDPFPHIVIENALEEAVYQQLVDQYPDPDLIRSGKEVLNRHQILAKDALVSDSISPLWQEFITYHISKTFFDELFAIFEGPIRSRYSWVEVSLGKLFRDFTCGARDSEVDVLPDLCLDCQPGLNVVSMKRTSPRSPHLDARNKLLTGLFYLKHDEDQSSGGDLQLYKVKKNRPIFSAPSTPRGRDIQVAATVPYQRNTVVFFLNSPTSVHGVSPRDGTPIPRRLVNWIAGAYSLKEKQLYPQPEVRPLNFFERMFTS